MAINLATKYSDKIATAFTHASYLAGKTCTEWDFDGVNSVKIYTPTTQTPTDYSRTGTSRYGTPAEMQDTVQTLTMSQDKSFAITIDKGNNQDQLNIKGAGKMMQLEVKEQMVPMADKYAFGVLDTKAAYEKVTASPTKSTVVSDLLDMEAQFDEKEVPETDRYLFVNPTIYNLIKLAPEWNGLETLGTKALGKGVVGQFSTFTVVKVPASKLGTNVHALAMHKSAFLFPFKMKDLNGHTNPPGISGHLLEGRYRYDAFVLDARKDGTATYRKATRTSSSSGTV